MNNMLAVQLEVLAAVMTAVPGGWDPGLTRRLAASAFPRSPHYTEFCPDSTTGRCYGTLPAGSGFYTLGGGSTNESCTINAGAASPWTPNAPNMDVPCPYKFSWQNVADNKKQAVVARVEVDSRNFKSGLTPNLYVGLQENLVVPPVYGGLNVNNATMVPPFAHVVSVTFDMRTKVCYGGSSSSNGKDQKGFGRIAIYFDYRNIEKRSGHGISIDIFTFLGAGSPYSPSMPIRRATPFYDDDNALHIDGGVFGIVPNDTVPMLDTTENCTASMDAAPWLNVNVSVQELTWKLVRMGFLNASDVEGSVLTGGIVNGVETWGKHWTTADVRNRIVWVKDPRPPPPT